MAYPYANFSLLDSFSTFLRLARTVDSDCDGGASAWLVRRCGRGALRPNEAGLRTAKSQRWGMRVGRESSHSSEPREVTGEKAAVK